MMQHFNENFSIPVRIIYKTTFHLERGQDRLETKISACLLSLDFCYNTNFNICYLTYIKVKQSKLKTWFALPVRTNILTNHWYSTYQSIPTDTWYDRSYWQIGMYRPYQSLVGPIRAAHTENTWAWNMVRQKLVIRMALKRWKYKSIKYESTWAWNTYQGKENPKMP